MSKELPISVLIPSYNRANQLEITLPLYLSLPVAEVILIDDHSDDHTEEKYSKFDHPKFKYIRNKRNLNLPGARNVGVKAARFEFILMGEDDVYIEAPYVIKLYEKLKELNADIIAGRLINLHENERREDALIRMNNVGIQPLSEFLDKRRLSCNYNFAFNQVIKTPFVHACSLFKREWVDRFPYNQVYNGNAHREESHFYFNCWRHGAKIFFYSDAVAYHMYHNYGGGCGNLRLKSIIYGVMNNSKFIEEFWTEIKYLCSIQDRKPLYKIKLNAYYSRMVFLSWVKNKFPNLFLNIRRLFKQN